MMQASIAAERDRWNASRFMQASGDGHYESWFQRANHPSRPLAFWIRYTIFSPRRHPDRAIGELWAMWFDGEKKRALGVKEEHPIGACDFDRERLDVRIDRAKLDGRSLAGTCRGAHSLEWALEYESKAAPILLVREELMKRRFPKGKVVTPSPHAVYRGDLVVDGERIAIDGWIGTQSHNWGRAQTDEYAWCQVAGFDDDPDAFFEAGSARYDVGPFRTPRLTGLVLRCDGEDILLNSVSVAVRARAHAEPFYMELAAKHRDVSVRASVSAPAWSFVALPYKNPPGGLKTCLNSKLASCTVHLEKGGRTKVLTSKHRAAFELLGDDEAPRGVSRLGS